MPVLSVQIQVNPAIVWMVSNFLTNTFFYAIFLAEIYSIKNITSSIPYGTMAKMKPIWNVRWSIAGNFTMKFKHNRITAIMTMSILSLRSKGSRLHFIISDFICFFGFLKFFLICDMNVWFPVANTTPLPLP